MSRSNASVQKSVLPSSNIELPAIRDWARAFPITSPRTRHDQLLRLIGAAFYQAGRGLSKRNAELQYDTANPVPGASLSEHFREFDEAWSGMERQWCRNCRL